MVVSLGGKPKPYIAPSWSWAAHNSGHTVYNFSLDRVSRNGKLGVSARVQDADVQTKGGDSFRSIVSARLELRCWLKLLSFRKTDWEEAAAAGEHTFEICGQRGSGRAYFDEPGMKVGDFFFMPVSREKKDAEALSWEVWEVKGLILLRNQGWEVRRVGVFEIGTSASQKCVEYFKLPEIREIEDDGSIIEVKEVQTIAHPVSVIGRPKEGKGVSKLFQKISASSLNQTAGSHLNNSNIGTQEGWVEHIITIV